MSIKISLQKASLVSCAAIGGLWLTPIVVSATESTADQDSQLHEIVVSAQRREEAIDKVPISITALSQRTMDDLHIVNVADLATVVPGIYFAPPTGSGPDITSVAIRGIYSNQNAPTTQFYIDETPIAVRQMGSAGNTYTAQPQIFDLSRVEVLRGPQGTLFGSSAMGGAIRFITPEPDLHDSSGFAKADFGYAEHGGPNYEVGAAYGSPIVEGALAFRVSAWFQSLGGFVDQEDPITGEILKKNINTSDSYVIRPAFTWAPSEALTITPSAFLQRKHSNSPSTYWLNDLPNSNEDRKAWGGLLQPLTDDLSVGSLAIKYNFGGLTFQSDTSYMNRKEHGNVDLTQFFNYLLTNGSPVYPSGTNFIPGFKSLLYDDSATNAFMQEFRLSSQDPSARVSWVAGAFYRHAVQQVEQLVPPDFSPITEAAYGQTSLQFFGGVPNYIYNGAVLSAYQNFYATDISEALFGTITVNVTSRLKADLGVRVEHSVVEHQDQFVAGPLDGGQASVVLPDQTANPVTPRASLTYQYTDADMVYVSASKGYRPGGGNSPNVVNNPLCDSSAKALGLGSVPSSFNSDSLWSYEVGAKSLLFDRKLSVQGSIFYIRWNDIQSSLGLPSCGGGFTDNFGLAISKGFDLQVEALITKNLKVHALVGYTDAYYPKAFFGAPNPAPDGPRPLLNDAGDKLTANVPWNAAINGEYSRDTSAIIAGSRSYVRVDFRWQSSNRGNLGGGTNNPNIGGYDPEASAHANQAYGTLNARFGLTEGGLDVSLYVQNATNADPLSFWYHSTLGDPLGRANAMQPRTFGVTAWYRF